jgi:hypothetical protein
VRLPGVAQAGGSGELGVHLVVDAPKPLATARGLDGLADQPEVEQELAPAQVIEVVQMID